MKAKLQILFLALSISALGVPSVLAQDKDQGKGNPNPGIIPPQAAYAGKTQGEWLQAWWNWIYGTKDYVQMYDGTGELADVNGNGDGPVFFLVKSWAGEPQERHITVPAGKAIYVPVMGYYMDSASGITDPEALKAADLATIPDAHGLAVTIDGRPVKDIWNYIQVSGIFTAYDVNWAPYVFYPAFAWEVSLLVAHLPPGEHVIHMQGSYQDWFTSDVTYYLTVTPKKPKKDGKKHHDDDDCGKDGKGK